MKVQLVVVRGKPEGKVIPLVGPNFKIGRGETCHLRPNSEQVSREHAEFTLEGNTVNVRDLGSRNGTLVNGKALTAEHRLKHGDLVQVGPLTFAVSISEAPAPAAKAAAAPPAAKAKAKASPDDVSGDEIDSWLLGEAAAAAESPTVYGGDTITITAFKDSKSAPAKPQPPASASDDEYERQAEEEEEPPAEVDVEAETAEDLSSEGESEEELGDPVEDEDDAEGEDEDEDEAPVEEFMDESNPFYAAKKAQQQQAKTGPAKPAFKDTSDAAGDILRRLMERRRANRES
jgi:predicted component of type VI protein secretion system